MRGVLWLALQLLAGTVVLCQEYAPRLYDIGTPALTEIYVDPIRGNDGNSGRSAAAPLRTLTTAWAAIPPGIPLTTGIRINLAPGSYPESSIPNYFELRYGTRAAPIIIRSSGSPGSAVLQGDINMFDCRFVYLLGLTIRPDPAGDTFHCEQCDHILLRDGTFDGGARFAHETIKVNQSTNFFIERSDVGGAGDNAIDFVAVQGGHIVDSRIYNAGDWCAYVKGGSARIRIEGNRIFNCGTGGFTAGQGTGFEFMTPPWLHYEAYDIKFFNNVVHDTEGAAIGVNGGFNVVMAFNTFYRVGRRSHGIEVVHGGRSCDGDTDRCAAHQALGGWGSPTTEEPIPNRHTIIANNILFNPSGHRSEHQHFAIHSPRIPGTGTNIPSPARTDTGLLIQGNIIWNGPVDLPLGIEDLPEACAPTNPTCSEAQLRVDNEVNTYEPELRDPTSGDLRPAPGSALLTRRSAPVPDFTDADRPTEPPVPSGVLRNLFPLDRGGAPRGTNAPPGAWVSPTSARSPADGGAGVDLPPSISIRRITLRSTRTGTRLTIRVTATDPEGALSRVEGSFSSRSFVRENISLRERGPSFTGSLTVPRRVTRGVLTIIAGDAEGQSRAVTRRVQIRRA